MIRLQPMRLSRRRGTRKERNGRVQTSILSANERFSATIVDSSGDSQRWPDSSTALSRIDLPVEAFGGSTRAGALLVRIFTSDGRAAVNATGGAMKADDLAKKANEALATRPRAIVMELSCRLQYAELARLQRRLTCACTFLPCSL
jgi:hypothetical protein